MKRIALILSALALLAFVVPAASVRAENPAWKDLMKAFKKDFKTKNPLKVRKKAVKSLARSKDARASRELLKVVKMQEREAGKLRDEWVREEAAWVEKTKKYEKTVDTGGGYVPDSEEDKWLGLSEQHRRRPKMLVEKNRIAGLYKQVLQEESALGYIYTSIARLVNSLEGEDRVKAARQATSAAKSAKADHKPHAIMMLAFMKGDDATTALESFAKDTDPTIAILAIEAIGRQNQERGIAILTDKLEDPRWQIRAAAIKGLTYYKDPNVMEALIAAAKKEEGVLRRKYFAAMARIVQERVPGTVEAWESFWRENKDDLAKRWGRSAKNEPVTTELPDIPIDTSLGSTSFYGISTNSKHILFVVDVSGSMSEEGAGTNEQGEAPIDVARKELKNAIKALSAAEADERGEPSFNIVIYSNDPRVYKEGKMITATAKAVKKANDWIDENVQPTGMTNIYDAVEQAFNIISDKKESKNLKLGADTIFLMTDGQPNRGKFIDPELILSEIKRMNGTRKLTIHAIGVGPGADRAFLSRLAAQNDGQYLGR